MIHSSAHGEALGLFKHFLNWNTRCFTEEYVQTWEVGDFGGSTPGAPEGCLDNEASADNLAVAFKG